MTSSFLLISSMSYFLNPDRLTFRSLSMLKRLLKNFGVTVKTIERCWPLITKSIDVSALVSSYLKDVQSAATSSVSFPHYYKASYTRKMLVHLAWRYGNDDNYFKMLPGEIIEMICQFNLDPARWEEIAEFLMQKTVNTIEFSTVSLPMDLQIKFGRFFCDNFTRFKEESHAKYLRNMFAHLPTASSYVLFDAFELLKYYIPKMKSYFLRRDGRSGLTDLLHLCLKTPSRVTKTDKKLNLTKKTQALDLLKVLLDFEPLRKFHQTECSCSDYKRTDRLPCFWRTISHKNVDAIEYLVRNNWMPLTASSTALSATEYACICGHEDLVKPLMEGTAKTII